MKKNFIFYIHSTTGLVSGIFILLMSLSGALLVFHEDLYQWQAPALHNNSNSAFSIHRSYAAIQQHYPQAQISSCDLPVASNSPLLFTIYDTTYQNGKKAMQVFLDPQTGHVLKTSGGSEDLRNNFMGWLSKFHNSFHLGKTGEWLLGFFALVFLLSIITGLVLFRKNIAGVFLFRRAVYKWNNLHQVIGVYALLFNLLMAVTGFWMQRYVFKKEFYAAGNYIPVLKRSPPLSFHFDSANNKIKKQFPDFTARVIYFAQSSKAKTAVYGSRASNAYVHSGKFADLVLLDSAGNISGTRLIEENTPSDKYDIINSQLHMGRFGGAGIKIIYFVFGLTGALLSITGFLLWLRRRKEKK
jgi:uncharacterized iron-regulated membrane protein